MKIQDATKEITRLRELERTLCRIRATELKELYALRKENYELKRMLNGQPVSRPS